MAEKPILGLRVGEDIPPRHEQIDRSKLLTNPEVELRDRSIEFIYVSLEECLGVELPLDLMSAMSFDQSNFRWRQLYHPNALSAIFIGRVEEGDEDTMTLDKAEGIIEAASFIPQGKTRIHADGLNLSGIVKDSKGSKRVAAVSYSLEKRYADQTLISVGEAEVPELAVTSRHYGREYRNSFRKLPSNLNPIYSPHLIITSAMVAQTQHRLALRIYVYPTLVHEGMQFDGHFVLGDVGFNARTENGRNYIGLRQNWEVGYPATL